MNQAPLPFDHQDFVSLLIGQDHFLDGTADEIGDDTVDLPGYAALDELAKGGVATTRVGVRSPESPAQLLQRADVVVDGPEGTLEWLRSLL